jgi:hypothetical protein
MDGVGRDDFVIFNCDREETLVKVTQKSIKLFLYGEKKESIVATKQRKGS